MKIRIVVGFALLLCVALVRPGSVFGSDTTEALSQATPIKPTVLAVVRNQGTQLHDRPDGEPLQSLVGGTLVTARLRSQDLKWVLVETRDESEGWVEVRTLLAAGLSRLPVEQPTPTPTATSAPTEESSPTAMPAATATLTATVEPEPTGTATATPAATGTPDGSMADVTPETTGTVTPEATGDATPEAGTPEPTVEGTPEATAEAVEPTATPFVPPQGPTALALTRIDGANLWQNEDGAFVAHFEAGKRLTAAYRTEESEWFFVYNDDGIHGWASAEELLVVGGDTLPVEEFLSDPTTEEVLEKVVVTVNTVGVRLNVRAGPGTEYDIVARAAAGVEFNVIGRTEESDWVQVVIADLPSGNGWVSAFYVTVSGSLELVPIVKEEEDETTEEGSSNEEESLNSPRFHLFPFTTHSTTTIV